MKSATDQLPVHPQPINKAAALHVAGGDKLGREELLWAQREAFNKIATRVRLEQVEHEVSARREMARATRRLETLPSGSNYTRDYKKFAARKIGRAKSIKMREKVLRAAMARLAP